MPDFPIKNSNPQLTTWEEIESLPGLSLEQKELIWSNFQERIEDSLDYQKNLIAFCRFFLPRYFYLDFGDVHYDLARNLEQLIFNNYQSMVQAMARSYAKTTFCGFAAPLFAALNGHKQHIMLIGPSMGNAEGMLANIKRELETNEVIRGRFGEQVGKVWRQHEIELTNGCVIKVRGFGSAIRGEKAGWLRPDLMIVDDLEDQFLIKSATQRQKYVDWLLATVMPALDPQTGSILCSGTILHYASMLNRLILGEIGDFQVRKRLPAIDEHGRSRWEAMWPVERLMAKKAAIGSDAFNKEYLCNPVSEDTSAFKREWLERCKDKARRFVCARPEKLEIYQAWDLSAVVDKERAETADTDFTVGVTVGFDPKSYNRYILRMYRTRGITPDDLRSAIIREAQIMNPDKVIVEANLFQNLYVYDLLKSTDLPIVRHVTGSNKRHYSPSSMAYLFENRKYIFPYGDDECKNLINIIIEELYGYGYERHDDTVMALWFIENYLANEKQVHAIFFNDEKFDPRTDQGLPIGQDVKTIEDSMGMEEYRRKAFEKSFEDIGIPLPLPLKKDKDDKTQNREIDDIFFF